MTIKHLNHHQIDLAKWDSCIEQSHNPLVYAMSWYLNIVCPRWEALVLGDYQAVMPLPKYHKYGISYFRQPTMTQQLGVFSHVPTTDSLIKSFLKKIPFRPYRLNLNEKNATTNGIALPNYILPLTSDYATLSRHFNSNTTRNIKKATNSDIRLESLDNTTTPLAESDKIVQKFTNFYYAVPKRYICPDRHLVVRLLTEAFQRGFLSIYFAYNGDNIASSLALLHSHKRLIYFMPISDVIGKKLSSMFFIIDNIIKKHQNSDLVLDFEGSRIETIARLYKGFGAEYTPYYQVSRWL